MLEARVSRLEDDVKEIRADVRDIKRDVADLKERFARMEGGFDAIRVRLDAMPTTWTFITALIATVLTACGLTAGIAALFLNAGP